MVHSFSRSFSSATHREKIVRMKESNIGCLDIHSVTEKGAENVRTKESGECEIVNKLFLSA